MKKGFLEGYKTYDNTEGVGSAQKWRKAFQQRFTRQEAESILGKQVDTPYTILGIEANATEAVIKKAFRKQITEWHPDRNQHRLAEAEEMAKKIIAAYTMLL